MLYIDQLATYLITGSNRGIGLEYCKQLSQRGEKVIAVCRKSSHELDNLNLRIEKNIDLIDNKSIDLLSYNLKKTKIDVLINNAGIIESDDFNNLDPKKLLDQFKVNALSPLYLTKKLIPNLQINSKVILMTSRMGSIEDNKSGSYYGYRMSKAALCMAGKSLSIDLYHYGICVALLHPGLVSTRMTNFTEKGISTQESVKGLLKRINDLSIKNSGHFWHANGEILPW